MKYKEFVIIMAEEKQIKAKILSLEQEIAKLAAHTDENSTTQRRAYKSESGQLHYSLFMLLAKSDPYQAVQSLYQSAMLGFSPAYDYVFFERPISSLPSFFIETSSNEPTLPETDQSPEQLFILGLQAFYGIGQEHNHRLALKYFKESASHGHAGAQERLAACCYYGDPEMAKWRIKAAEQGHPHAQYLLGRNYLHDYLHGEGVPKDVEKGIQLLTLAVNQDYLPAFITLAYRYAFGNGIQKDQEKAEALITIAAKSGFADAQFILGNVYLKAFVDSAEDFPTHNLEFHHWCELKISKTSDSEYNKKMAIYWYTLAADQGDYSAQIELSKFYSVMLKQSHDFALKQALFTKYFRIKVLLSFTLAEESDGNYSLEIRYLLNNESLPFISQNLFSKLLYFVFANADTKPPEDTLFHLCGFLHNFPVNVYELTLLDFLKPLFEQLTENAAEQLEKYWPTVRTLNDQTLISLVQSQHAQIIELQQQVRALQQSQMTSTANLSVVEDEEPEEEPRVKKHSHSDEEEIEAAIDAEHTNDYLQDQFRFVGKRAKKSKITTPPEEMPQNSDDFELKESSLDLPPSS